MSTEKQLQDALQLIEAQKQYRIDSEKSLKDEIGKKLHSEFEDFFETVDFPMSEILGEIYRCKLLQIAKILASYDITV